MTPSERNLVSLTNLSDKNKFIVNPKKKINNLRKILLRLRGEFIPMGNIKTREEKKEAYDYLEQMTVK